MKTQITPQSFRQDYKNKQDTVRSWVDKNYEQIWKLMEEASIIDNTGFRVETAHGSVQFIGKLTPLI